MSEFVGKKIKDADGNEFVVKKATYTGVATGKDLKVIKKMSIMTNCGKTFDTTKADLEKALFKQ